MLLHPVPDHHTRPGVRLWMHAEGRTGVRVLVALEPQTVVVLDLDGTLVDSVYHHVIAWQTAFHDVGLHVSGMRIHEAIGMGGDRLVAHVAGAPAETAVGDDLRQLHDKHFRAGLRSIAPLDGASDLVDALADLGHRLAVASSSEADLVDELLDLVESRSRLSAVLTGSDEAPSKPAPDLVQLAVERAGGGTAIAVGDAVWDALAAEAAGVPCIGLRSGGVGAERLLTAGASWVYDGPGDLLAQLAHSPLRPH